MPGVAEKKDAPRISLSPTPYPLASALTAFSEAIEAHEHLEIDDDFVKEGEAPSPETHKLKIVNHERQTAYAVPLQASLDYSPKTLIEALETGILNPLYGVTRIVGYYSRIQNWNKSKLGELADRHRGNYRVGAY